MIDGLEQGKAPVLTQKGLLVLENATFDKYGTLSKRTGTEQAGTSTYSEVSMAALGDRPILLGDDSVKVHDDATPASGDFTEEDSLFVMEHSVSQVSAIRSVRDVTIAESGDVRAVAYAEVNSSGTQTDTLKVFDIETGSLLASQTYSSGGIRVVYNGARLLCFLRQAVSSDIDVVEINTTTGAIGSTSTPGTIANVDGSVKFDVCALNDADNAVLLAYKETVANNCHVVTIEDNLTVKGAPYAISLNNCQWVHCFKQTDGLGVVLSGELTVTPDYDVHATAFDDDCNAQGTALVWSGTGSTDQMRNAVGVAISGTTSMVYVSTGDTSGASNGKNDALVYRIHITCSGGSVSAGTGQNWMFGVWAVAAMATGTTVYLVVKPYDTTTDQWCYLVLRADGNSGGDDLNGEVCARILPGYGGGSNREMCGAVVDVATDQWRFGVPTKISDDDNAVAIVDINRNVTNIFSVEGDDRLLIEGSVGYEFDGVDAFESGFLLYPKAVNPTDGGAGALTGNFFYTATYSFIDSKGCIHRSAPAPVSSITVTSKDVDVDIPTTKLHRKALDGKVVIEVWRTEDVGSFFYKVGEIENLQNVNQSTFTDTVLDATLIANEPLYKQPSGPTLGHLSPQPWNVGCIHQGRFFFADREYPETRIYYTNKKVHREGYHFNDVLVITVPPDGGVITALASYRDRLIVFKENRIYATYGKGLSPTGQGTGYAEPVLLTNAAGCSVKKSVVECPAGLLFKSSTLVWLLDSKLTAAPMGDSVEYATDSVTINRAVAVPDKDYVVFLTTGDHIVYHYLTNTWSTFSNADGASDGIVALGGLVWFRLGSVSDSNMVIVENRSVYTDQGTQYFIKLETGWVHPATIGGWSRVYGCLVTGSSNVADCRLRCKFAYDNINYWVDSQSYDMDTLPAFSEVSQYGDGVASSFRDDALIVDFATSQQKVTSIRVHISDENLEGDCGAGLSVSALSLIYGTKEGAMRLGDRRRA
jgi:hypothetical protein